MKFNNKKLYKDVCKCGHGYEVHIENGCAICPCSTLPPEDIRVLDPVNLPARKTYPGVPDHIEGYEMEYRVTNVIEQDPEECIHGMWPPEKCTICLSPKTDSGFKFELKEDDVPSRD